jgi:hypothetical protein
VLWDRLDDKRKFRPATPNEKGSEKGDGKKGEGDIRKREGRTNKGKEKRTHCNKFNVLLTVHRDI